MALAQSRVTRPVKKVLLVGANSFLARAVLAAAPPDIAITACAHDSFTHIDFSCFDIITNFSWNPGYRTSPYDESLDQDLAVARRAARAGRHFVMLSTRRVYGTRSPFPARSDTPLAPSDTYSRNKAQTEMALRDLPGGGLTVLRVANVFGFEPGRPTFFGIALTSLRARGRIVLDCAATVRRDFLPAENFASAFCRVLRDTPSGTFNLGAGSATALGDIASALFRGFGRGELLVTSPQEHDSFLLDSGPLVDRIGPYCTPADIVARCIEIGKKLHENRT